MSGREDGDMSETRALIAGTEYVLTDDCHYCDATDGDECKIKDDSLWDGTGPGWHYGDWERGEVHLGRAWRSPPVTPHPSG
jgi:hypothetical protein